MLEVVGHPLGPLKVLRGRSFTLCVAHTLYSLSLNAENRQIKRAPTTPVGRDLLVVVVVTLKEGCGRVNWQGLWVLRKPEWVEVTCVSEKSGNSLCRRTLSQVSWVLGGPRRGRAWGARSLPAVDLPGSQPDWSAPVPSSPYPGTGLWQTLLSWGASWGSSVCFLPGPWSVLSSSLKGAAFRQGAGQFRGNRFLHPSFSSLYILSAFLASSLPLTSSRTHYIHHLHGNSQILLSTWTTV